MRLELAGCLDADRDAIQRAVRVELGDAADDFATAGAIDVRIDCAADGIDAGVVLEVRPPASPRRYRYALDWHAQPLDARPRLLGLAVAEAVDASRLELTAVPEPAPPGPHTVGAPPLAREPPSLTVGLVGSRRSFSGKTGVSLLGAGLAPALRLSGHLRLEADLLIEGTTVLAASGAVAIRSLSAAPRLAYRAGGRLYGELGLGLRAGLVRMQGRALPRSQLAPTDGLVRGWLGPTAGVAVGVDVTARAAITASFEVGVATAGATARDLGEPIAAVDGSWTAFGLAIAIAL